MIDDILSDDEPKAKKKVPIGGEKKETMGKQIKKSIFSIIDDDDDMGGMDDLDDETDEDNDQMIEKDLDNWI